MKNLRWVILSLVVAMCTSFVAGETNIPKLDQRVNDFTNTLSFQEWQTVDHLLKSYEDTTSTQIVVLMVNSLEGESIEEYANKTFEVNQIGQLKNDNGVLLVIAKQDHEVKIEVGYGLESALTDAVSSQIIRQEILPYLKADNYFGGIVTGVDAIVRATAGEYHVDALDKKTLSMMIIVAVIFIVAIAIVIPLLLTLRKALNRCSPESRTMTPQSVWLLFIPLFNIVWQFIVVSRVATSLGNEFKRRNITKEPYPGKKIGIAGAILGVCSGLLSIVPIIGIITAILGLILMIVYWRKIARYSAEIALPYRIE